MATVSERLALLISADVDDAVRGLNKLDREAGKSIGSATSRADELGSKLTKVGAGMLATGTLAVVGLGRAAAATSDLNEATTLTSAIFGDAADEIGEFAKGAAEIGQSERAAREAATTFGGLLQNLEFAADETVDWSKKLTVLASDLGSAFNSDPEDAVLALGAALRGESEPIRRFNVMLDDATVRQRAVEMGLAATTAEVDNHGKAQARLALIMEQTQSVQGDFANTSDGLANSQRQFNAQLENFQAALGEGLLPVMEKMLGLGNSMLEWFNKLDPGTQKAVSQAAAVTTGFLLIGGAFNTVAGTAIKFRGNLKTLAGMLKGSVVPALTAATIATAAYMIHQSRAAEDAKFAARIQGLFAAALSDTGDEVEAIARVLARLANDSNLVGKAMNELGIDVDDVAAAFAAGDEEAAAMVEMLQAAAAVTGSGYLEVDAFGKFLWKLVDAFEAGSTEAEIFTEMLGTGEDAASEIGGELDVLGRKVDTVSDKVDRNRREWEKLAGELDAFDAHTAAQVLLEDAVELLGNLADMTGPEARAELGRIADEYGEVSQAASETGADVTEEMGLAQLAIRLVGDELELSEADARSFDKFFSDMDGKRVNMTAEFNAVMNGIDPGTAPWRMGTPPAPEAPPTYGGMTATEWAQLRDQEIVIHNNLSVDGRVLAESYSEAYRSSGGQIE